MLHLEVGSSSSELRHDAANGISTSSREVERDAEQLQEGEDIEGYSVEEEFKEQPNQQQKAEEMKLCLTGIGAQFELFSMSSYSDLEYTGFQRVG